MEVISVNEISVTQSGSTGCMYSVVKSVRPRNKPLLECRNPMTREQRMYV
jgi:hypothetical protein